MRPTAKLGFALHPKIVFVRSAARLGLWPEDPESICIVLETAQLRRFPCLRDDYELNGAPRLLHLSIRITPSAEVINHGASESRP